MKSLWSIVAKRVRAAYLNGSSGEDYFDLMLLNKVWTRRTIENCLLQNVSGEGILVAKMTVGYFLEDIAQERFITALVQRIASEQAIPAGDLQHDVRNATGGVSIREFKQFLRLHEKARVGF
jgi:hypothetical protein